MDQLLKSIYNYFYIFFEKKISFYLKARDSLRQCAMLLQPQASVLEVFCGFLHGWQAIVQNLPGCAAHEAEAEGRVHLSSTQTQWGDADAASSSFPTAPNSQSQVIPLSLFWGEGMIFT